jgi:hypothetical protein
MDSRRAWRWAKRIIGVGALLAVGALSEGDVGPIPVAPGAPISRRPALCRAMHLGARPLQPVGGPPIFRAVFRMSPLMWRCRSTVNLLE